MLRLWLALFSTVVVLLALGSSSALAYSTPSGLGSYPTLCPPRPADAGAAATSPSVVDSQTLSVAGGATGTVTSTGLQPGGAGQVSIANATDGTSATVWIDVQDAAGSWHRLTTFSATGGYASAPINLPPGPLRVTVAPAGSGSKTWYVQVYAATVSAGETTLQQQIVDDCVLAHGDALTAHTDSAAVDVDVQSVKSAVNALTSAGTTLTDVKNAVSGLGGSGSSTATLATIDADLQTLDSDVKATSAGGSSGAPQLVQLSSADRQLQADSASSLHGDLWVVVGAIVGVFAAAQILNRVLP